MDQHVFARVPSVNVPRSVFPLDHNLKTTMDVNNLYPIFVGEALPGDTFVFHQKIFGRMTTPLTPLMDDLYLDTFYFAVPVRLVDPNFKYGMGETFGPDESLTDYTVPMLNSGETGVPVGSLFDYLGVPPGVPNLDFCAWFPRAYNLVWSEYFRDENLQHYAAFGGMVIPPLHAILPTDEIPEALDIYNLLPRGKRHDYFTSCLPWPQKGTAPQMTLTGASASVVPDGYMKFTNTNNSGVNHSYVLTSPGGTTTTNLPAGVYNLTFPDSNPQLSSPATTTSNYFCSKYDSGLGVTFDDFPAFSVNEFRDAVAMQHLCEEWARTGSRYTEILRGCFGVISPDERLQRPEYLGGSSQPLNVTTIAQTSESTESSPLGNLASFVTMDNEASFTKSFTEHTIILGLANIRANLTYAQGLPRMFSRRTKFDFYWPALANLGEQAVLNKEIYAQGASVLQDDNATPVDDGVFGYQERWAEYRYMPNRLTGLMRPQVSGTLASWHLAQNFANLPVLNDEFIAENVPIDRVVAVTDEPPFLVDAYFSIRAARPMPLYSVPGLNRL